MKEITGNNNQELFKDISEIINKARNNVAQRVNSELTMMYWHIGKRINQEVLKGERAEYGKQIVSALSVQLQKTYGQGFTSSNLRRMMQFATLFPDIQIVAPLVRQLSWTHFLEVMPVKDPLAREFYITMAADERWSKRELQKQIDSMLYERTAISRKARKSPKTPNF